MKRLKTPIILSFATILYSCGSHGALKSDLDAYQPSNYYQINVQSPSAKHTLKKRSVLESGSNKELEQLSKLKKHWQHAALKTDAAMLFYANQNALIDKLDATSQNTAALEALLSKGFYLREFEALTLLRNPGVKSAQNYHKAALEGFSQVAQLDEILRQYAAFTEGVMTGVGPMKGREPIQMKFPFPGVTALKGQVVNQSVKVASENLSIARRDAVTAARRSYWDLVFVVQAQTITSETLDLFEHLESVATARYESGSTSYQDVIKVRIERATVTEDLKTWTEQRRTVAARIRALLDLSTKATIGDPRDQQPPHKFKEIKALYPLAREHRQELRRLRANIGKMERMIEMAETMILPAYSTNLSLYQDAAVTQVGSSAMQESFPVTVRADTGTGLPKLPWYGTQDAYLRETRQKVAALKEELRKAEADTDAMVHKAWFKLDQALREVVLYGDTIVDLSQTSLDVSTRGYEAGKVTFADVIGSYTQWLKTRLALARKNSDLGIAWAELEQTVGTSLSTTN